MLIRQSRADPTDWACYVVCAATGTTLAEVARVAVTRWVIEQGLEAASPAAPARSSAAVVVSSIFGSELTP